jgi:hypothetical protein
VFQQHAHEDRHGLGRRLVGDAEQQVRLPVPPVLQREVARQDLPLLAHEAIGQLAQHLVQQLAQVGRVLQLFPDRLVWEIMRRLVGGRHGVPPRWGHCTDDPDRAHALPTSLSLSGWPRML